MDTERDVPTTPTRRRTTPSGSRKSTRRFKKVGIFFFCCLLENGWGNPVETSCLATLTAGVVRKKYYMYISYLGCAPARREGSRTENWKIYEEKTKTERDGRRIKEKKKCRINTCAVSIQWWFECNPHHHAVKKLLITPKEIFVLETSSVGLKKPEIKRPWLLLKFRPVHKLLRLHFHPEFVHARQKCNQYTRVVDKSSTSWICSPSRCARRSISVIPVELPVSLSSSFSRIFQSSALRKPLQAAN